MTFKFGSLSIDPVGLGSAGNAILGIRDSGKTYTATLLAERLFEAGIPFVAFDPIGVWRFLRVPGNGRGYPIVVAGGQHGDLPLSPHSAPAIVEAAMHNGVSLVLDLFSLDLSKADWKRIVRDVMRLLLHRNSPHGLRHVFIEEAAEFAPQILPRGDSGPGGEVYAEIEKLARMGGNARLGYTLINQRAEEVNKAVLELCDNLFLHRQKGRNSLTALSKWLDVGAVKDHKQIIDTLATLPTGECWAWLAGTERPVHVKVPAKNSLHPDRRVMRGDTDVKAKPAVDVGAFVETMRSTLEHVEQEAKENDPRELKKRIAELEQQLAGGGEAHAGASADELEAAEQRGYDRGRADGVRERADALRSDLAGVLDAIGDARAVHHERFAAIEQRVTALAAGAVEYAPNDEDHAQPPLRTAPPRAEYASTPLKHAPAPPAAGLTAPEQRVLDALAWWASIGVEQPDKGQIGFIAGYRVGRNVGGTFGNLLGALRRRELLDYPSAGAAMLTPKGAKLARPPREKPTTAALQEAIHDRLDAPESRVLQAVIDAYPNAITKQEAGRRSGYTVGENVGGTFGNILGRLRSLGLIDYPKAGMVVALPVLFLKGRK